MNLSQFFCLCFWQNNSFCGVICIPMDGSSPLLTLLWVCGVCKEVEYVRVLSGAELVDVEKVSSLGLFLIGMLNQLHLWRSGQWSCCSFSTFPFHSFVVFPPKRWRMESLLSGNASEVQAYGIKYLSGFFLTTWHELGLINPLLSLLPWPVSVNPFGCLWWSTLWGTSAAPNQYLFSQWRSSNWRLVLLNYKG